MDISITYIVSISVSTAAAELCSFVSKAIITKSAKAVIIIAELSVKRLFFHMS